MNLTFFFAIGLAIVARLSYLEFILRSPFMFTVLTTCSLAAAGKHAFAWGTPVQANVAQTRLAGDDVTLAGRCVR